MSGLMVDPQETADYRTWGGGSVENATSVSADVIGADLGTTNGFTFPVNSGDLMLLVHVVDRGANLAALGAPNTVGNPWQALTSVDYGVDGPKLRVWKKFATATDQGGTATYTVTSTVASFHQLFVTIIPAGLVDPNTAIISATATRLGLPHTHPQVSIPSGYKTRERCYGLAMGLIAGATRASNGWTLPDFGGSYQTNGWYGTNAQVLVDTSDTHTNNLSTFIEYSQVFLDPAKSVPASGPIPDASWEAQGGGHCPTVSVTLLLLPWSSYRSPTAGLMSGLTDTYSTPLDSRVTTTGTPTINSSNQLVLKGGDSVTYAGVRSIRESQVTIEVPQAAVTGTDRVTLQMQSQLWPNYNRIFVGTGVSSSTNTCCLLAGNQDNLYSGIGYYRSTYDPVAHRWWRVRVEGAVLLFDTSPDKVTWFTQYEAAAGDGEGNFALLQDQLDDMQLTLMVTGSTSTTAIFDNLGQPFSWQPDTVPTARTTAWQGYTSSLKSTWHGKDVLVGICDQGTTQAVRTAQGITMTKRTYLAGPPPTTGNMETFPGEPHGCFVTSCGVPTGGKFVEAVITAYSGSSSTSTICSALLWCAQQGAKVINLSFGGGSDDQVFRDTFTYLATAYDVQIFIAAGNSNYPYVEVPAAYADLYPGTVHSVGAFDEITSTRAYFSDHEETMSGVAPGLNVTGLTPSGRPVIGSGTSYASPLSVQVCARLLTGAKYAPAHVGVVMNQSARDTGAARSDQGNGAYDLGRAVAAINLPEKTLLPDIAMPRFVDGQWADVAEGFDDMAEAVDLKGIACLVRRTSVAATLQTSTNVPIPWEQLDVDTYGGMWDSDYPSQIFIPVPGFYEVTAVVRFNYTLAAGGSNTGAPYNAGTRKLTICYNGGDPVANGIANVRQPASTDGEGVTLSVTTVAAFDTGDFLLANIWQDSGGTIECVQNDFTGTYLAVSRLAPLAPTLSGTVPPVTGLTVTSDAFNAVSLSWTNSTGDQVATLIRRNTGAVAPVGITEGTSAGVVYTPGTTLVDGAVASGTQYSYAAFARSASYVYADPATVTVTTPAAPPPPSPTTGLAVTTVGTTSLGLTWTNPTSSNFAGTMLRRNDGVTTAPTGPTDGSLIANLAPGVTSYTDSNLSVQTTYAYAAFAHTSDPVYAAGATTTRATTVDIAIHGSAVPSLTSIRTDGPRSVGVQFSVSAAAWFKAFRFYRPNTTVTGPFQFALWDLAVMYGGTPGAGVNSAGLVIGTNVTYDPTTFIGWLTVPPTSVPTLTANRAYVCAVYVPKGMPETTPFWAGTGYGTSGLTSTAGTFTITAPSRANASYTHAQETYGTSATVVPTTDGGTNGPCWWIDPLINPVT